MIWVGLAAEAASWSAWLWQHRHELEPVLQKVNGAGEMAQAALTDPNGMVRRIGNTIVFGQPGGGEQVLAFVEQTGPRIDAISEAVNGIHAQNEVFATSLASLQSLSMVSLGLIALTPVVLSAQLMALGWRLKTIGKMVADMKDMIEARNEADLRAGLDHLGDGQKLLRDGKDSKQRLGDALDHCKGSMFFFDGLLGRELNAKAPRRQVVSLLARQCAVALGGTVAAHVALGEDQFALEKIDRLTPRLCQGSKWIFGKTVGRSPERFLEPGLSPYKVDLTFLAELFNQANQAGAMEPCKIYTETSLFEDLRPRMSNIGRPTFSLYTTYVAELARDLREALASIEETNRVLGMKKLIQETQRSGRKTVEVMEEVRARAETENTESCPFAVWAP